MVQLTAPLTMRQLALLKTRACLERRLCAPTTCDYRLTARVEEIDRELTSIETAKHREVPV